MTLQSLAPRRLSIAVEDDVAFSQYDQPYTPLGKLQGEFEHIGPNPEMRSPNQNKPAETTVETGSQMLYSMYQD